MLYVQDIYAAGNDGDMMTAQLLHSVHRSDALDKSVIMCTHLGSNCLRFELCLLVHVLVVICCNMYVNLIKTLSKTGDRKVYTCS